MNTLASIVVDPTLVNDVAFWDWALIPTENNDMKLYTYACKPNAREPNYSDAASSLAAAGADPEDITYYDHIFNDDSIIPTPEAISALPRPSALLVSAEAYREFDEAVLDKFDKVILRRGESEGNEQSDIDVSSLGELRALSICSYALITKKT